MTKHLIACVLVFIGGLSLNAQEASLSSALPLFLKINIRKSGPYLGIQRGKYGVLELGIEKQWKQVKLKPITQAANMGFNYNFKYNVLGYDAGYWIKPNRFSLTYGGKLLFRTDFAQSRIGFAPVIGFKFWFLHLQTGYQFIPRINSMNTNTFFISLRFVLINERDVSIQRKKKK